MKKLMMSKAPSTDYCYGWNVCVDNVKETALGNRSYELEAILEKYSA